MSDYKKQLAWSKIKVGLIVTGALTLLFLAILFAGNIQNLFASKTTIYATFNDVKGLKTGAPVWFSGVQIGSVKDIGFAGDKITVAMTVDRDALTYLKKDSEARILTLGLLGDKYMEVSPGSKNSESLRTGGVITGSTRLEIDEQLSEWVNSLEKNKGSLGRLIEDDMLYRDLSASAKDIRRFAETLKTSEGTVDKFIKDPALYNKLLKASESLDTFAQRLASSKGTVNRLIEDESLYENVNEAAAKLNVLLDKINKGEGTAGSLVNSKELEEDLQTTLKELKLLIKDIKENPKKYFNFSIF
jgi:phospholipid/cholesterol/gamma-HCH transport system substrate-binding protein